MRIKANVDANQAEVVKTFRSLGATVEHLHRVGGGCTDLAIGYAGLTVMVEIKDGSKKPSERKLNENQVIWHNEWRGWKAVVESVQDCINLIAAIRKVRDQIKDWPSEL